MEKQLNIRVFGKVQGVWFRQSVKETADSLGLKGVVLNEDDGSVYISVRGEEQLLEVFLNYCEKGPPAATVSKVLTEEVDLKDFKDFAILR